MKTIMFHYVKDNFDYFHYDLKKFDKLICYLSSKYNIVSYEDLKNKNIFEMDDSNILLTFDDGTIDHYENVYPILKKYNCSGLFFISDCIFTGNVLDIQLIHQILSKQKIEILYDELIEILKKYNYDMKNIDLINTLDNQKMAFFKQILQYIIPSNIKNKILDYFCEKYDISNKVEDYYISREKMLEMKSNGMFFGVHTCSHPRLSKLSYEKQKTEIEKNMNNLFKNKLIDFDCICIAYPFGDYDKQTLRILKELGIKYGFITDNSLISNNEYKINRIDCNKLEV